MASPVTSTLRLVEDLFLKFNSRRLAMAVALIVMLITVLVVVEHVTGFLYLWQIERQVEILTHLESIETSDPQHLDSSGKQLSSDLASFRDRPSPIPTVGVQNMAKFISGGSLGLLFVLVALVPARNDQNTKQQQKPGSSTSMLYGGLAMTLIFGAAGAVVPTAIHWMLNVLIYLAIWGAFIALVVKLQKRKAG